MGLYLDIVRLYGDEHVCIQHNPRNNDTVRHVVSVVVWRCLLLPISFRVNTLAKGQSYDCSSVSKINRKSRNTEWYRLIYYTQSIGLELMISPPKKPSHGYLLNFLSEKLCVAMNKKNKMYFWWHPHSSRTDVIKADYYRRIHRSRAVELPGHIYFVAGTDKGKRHTFSCYAKCSYETYWFSLPLISEHWNGTGNFLKSSLDEELFWTYGVPHWICCRF